MNMRRQWSLAISVMLPLLVFATPATAQQWWCRMCGTWHGSAAENYAGDPLTQATSLLPQFSPTPPDAIDISLQSLQLTEDDTLYDIGCGDGRVLIRAVELYGCKGLGIEIDPQMAAMARKRVARSGYQDRIRIQEADAARLDYHGADSIFMHLYPTLISELLPKLLSKRIASYAHGLPGVKTSIIYSDDNTPIFVYTPEPVITPSMWPGWSFVE